MILDSAHLDLLAALIRHDTLASASAAIHLSPSAASRRLQEAERRLGFPLATVEGRSTRLTPGGRIVAEAAAAAANQLAEAELAARWLGSGTTRPLRIGVGFFDTISWALPCPADQAVAITRVDVRPDPGALASNEVDVIIDARSTCPTANAVSLAKDYLVLVCNPEHPLARRSVVRASDIASLRYLASAIDPQPGFEFDSFFRPANSCPTNITTIEALSCLLDLAATGDAVTIQPSRAVPEHRGDLRCVNLDRKIPIEWVALTGSSPDEATSQFLSARRYGE